MISESEGKIKPLSCGWAIAKLLYSWMIRSNKGNPVFMHIAVIPARSGSKGVPHKNMITLWGHSLIAWAVACARETSLFSDIILSTDDPDYATEGQAHGCRVPYLRPASLAGDTTPMADVLLDLVENVTDGDQWQTITLFQPTNPFRTPEMVKLCFEQLMQDPMADISLTVSPVPVQYHAARQKQLDAEGHLKYIHEGTTPATYRQALEPTYIYSGDVYVYRCSSLRATRQGLAGRLRGHVVENTINIDSFSDVQALHVREAESEPPAWAHPWLGKSTVSRS